MQCFVGGTQKITLLKRYDMWHVPLIIQISLALEFCTFNEHYGYLMLWDFDQRQDTTCVTVQIYCKWECENYFHQVPIKLKFKESYCDTIKETYLENSETLSWATQTIVSVQETISPSL